MNSSTELNDERSKTAECSAHNTYLIAIVSVCWFHAFVNHEQVAFYVLPKKAENLLSECEMVDKVRTGNVQLSILTNVIMKHELLYLLQEIFRNSDCHLSAISNAVQNVAQIADSYLVNSSQVTCRFHFPFRFRSRQFIPFRLLPSS